MARLQLGPKDDLYYEYDSPSGQGVTFVFVNALTGNTGMWQADIGPRLRAEGHGVLAYNFRGQQHSSFDAGIALTPELIVADLKRLLEEIAPPRPVLAGLSIGGLFAAQAVLQGAAAEGLVLINTLRKPSQRLKWLNEAQARAMAMGGGRLLMDLYLPLLVGPAKLREMREGALDPAAYEPMDPDHGHDKLMQGALSADWHLPYEELDVPVLVMTGLKDRVFYDEDEVAELLGRLPRAEHLTMREYGHLIPAEAPQETAAALLGFAETLRAD
ncbi:MAG: alpha/beta hydrolase [Rhodovibrionaceae bacterium]|nr:alpha/beta hydrolase [Rhodovibrionaceae bacterium]